MIKLGLLKLGLQFATSIAIPYSSTQPITEDLAYDKFYIRLSDSDRKLFDTLITDTSFVTHFKSLLKKSIIDDPFTDMFQKIKQQITDVKEEALVTWIVNNRRKPTNAEKDSLYSNSAFKATLKSRLKLLSATHSTFINDSRINLIQALNEAKNHFKLSATAFNNLPKIINDAIIDLKNDANVFTPFADKTVFTNRLQDELFKKIPPSSISTIFNNKLIAISNAAKDKALSNGIDVNLLQQEIDAEFMKQKNSLQSFISNYSSNKDLTSLFQQIRSIDLDVFNKKIEQRIFITMQALQKSTMHTSIQDGDIDLLNLDKIFIDWKQVDQGALTKVDKGAWSILKKSQSTSEVIYVISIKDKKSVVLMLNGVPLERQVIIKRDSKVNSAAQEIDSMIFNHLKPWNSEIQKKLTNVESLFNKYKGIKKRYEKVLNFNETTLFIPPEIGKTDGVTKITFTITDKLSKVSSTVVKNIPTPLFKNSISEAFGFLQNIINSSAVTESNMHVGPLKTIEQMNKIFGGSKEPFSDLLKRFPDIKLGKNISLTKTGDKFSLNIGLESKTLGPTSQIQRSFLFPKVVSMFSELKDALNAMVQKADHKAYRSWNTLNLDQLEYLFPEFKKIKDKFSNLQGFSFPTIHANFDLISHLVTLKYNANSIPMVITINNIKVFAFDTEIDRFIAQVIPYLSPEFSGLEELVKFAGTSKTLNRQEIMRLFPWISNNLRNDFVLLTITVDKIKLNRLQQNSVNLSVVLISKSAPSIIKRKSVLVSEVEKAKVNREHFKLIHQADLLNQQLALMWKVEKSVQSLTKAKYDQIRTAIDEMKRQWNNDLGFINSPAPQIITYALVSVRTDYELDKYIKEQQLKLAKLTAALSVLSDQSKKLSDLRDAAKKVLGQSKLPASLEKRFLKIDIDNIPTIAEFLKNIPSLSSASRILLLVFGSILGVVTLGLVYNVFTSSKTLYETKRIERLNYDGSHPKASLPPLKRMVSISVLLSALSLAGTIWSFLTTLL